MWYKGSRMSVQKGERSFCTYQFIAGPKRGQTCNRFLRKGQGQYCYQHRKGIVEDPSLIDHKQVSEKSTKEENKPAPKSVKGKGKTVHQQLDKSQVLTRKPKVKEVLEKSEESSEQEIPEKAIPQKTAKKGEAKMPKKVTVLQLEISDSSSISTTDESFSDSSSFDDSSTD